MALSHYRYELDSPGSREDEPDDEKLPPAAESMDARVRAQRHLHTHVYLTFLSEEERRRGVTLADKATVAVEAPGGRCWTRAQLMMAGSISALCDADYLCVHAVLAVAKKRALM